MSRERELIARIEGRMDKGWRRVTFEGAELDVLLKALRDMADIERLRAELKRFLVICGEGSSRGRAIDLIDKRDLDRARAALEDRP